VDGTPSFGGTVTQEGKIRITLKNHKLEELHTFQDVEVISADHVESVLILHDQG
jgi:hypothetical protein